MKDIFDDMNTGAGVDNYLSLGEFEELRLLLSSAKAAFATEDEDIVPRPDIQNNLRQMVAARRSGFHWPSINISKLLYFPLPAYQVGIAVALLMVLMIFTGRNNSIKSDGGGTVFHKTDTIYEKVYKKVPVMALSDSESRLMKDVIYGPSYADSMEMYNNRINAGEESGGDINTKENNAAPSKPDSQPSREINDQQKGGNYMEDSSKGNMQWHSIR